MISPEKLKWQPFVPLARANAQAVVNVETGAAADIILCAGIKKNNTIKLAEIFALHPGHHDYEMLHYIHTHVVVSEEFYNEEKACWRYIFYADIEKQNYIIADFVVLPDNRMHITLEASNKSDDEVEWVVSLLGTANVFCDDSKIDKNVFEVENNKFDFQFDEEWFKSAPLNATTPYLQGMLLEWGAQKCPANKKYFNRFRKWMIPPNGDKICNITIGCNNKAKRVTNSELPIKPERILAGQTKDDWASAMEHLANQILFNRSYPPSVNFDKYPEAIYSPGASFDKEYFWDAGFIAAALAHFVPQKAKDCIAQHLPNSNFTLFPNAYGAKALTHVLAAWELYQVNRNKQDLEDLYPGLHDIFLYCTGYKEWSDGSNLDDQKNGLLKPHQGGSGLDDSPSQIWSRGEQVGWARQNHYWAKPIEVNKEQKALDTVSVNMTALGIISARILQLICSVIKIDEPPVYSDYISNAEKSLNKKCWSQKTGHFHWIDDKTETMCPYYDLSGLTPLCSNSYDSYEQCNQMLQNLENFYLTNKGLTTVDQNADFFRIGYWCGVIWIPFHWLFWKSLIGIGRIELADKIAKRVLNTYGKSFEKLPVCYETFDLQTGRGGGDFSFGGLASILINLWAAYRKKKTISTGYFTIIDKIEISSNLDSVRLEFRSNEKSDSTGIIIVMKSKTKYEINLDECVFVVESDDFGCVQFKIPAEKDKNYKLFIKKI